MDAAHEDAYWLAATPTDATRGSPVYYKASGGRYHALIHTIIPPVLDVACEQWHDDLPLTAPREPAWSRPPPGRRVQGDNTRGLTARVGVSDALE